MLLGVVGAVSALDLGEIRGRRVNKVSGSGDLIGSFLEGTGFEAAVKVDTEFTLDKEGAKAGAGEVLT